MTPPPENRDALWAALVDGALSPDEFARLQELLARDPAARQRYIDLMLLDTLLAEELGAESIGDMIDALSPPNQQTPSQQAPSPQTAAKAKPAVAEHSVSVGRARRWAVSLFATAASLLIGFGLWSFWGLEPQALAATLITETLRVHQLPVDRCYVIKVEKIGDEEPRLWNARPRVDRLWTRGDRFFLESSTEQVRFRWGQDVDGRVWMTHGRRTGMTYEPNELPPWLATVCDALAMRLEPMLGEVLNHCDLTWEENPGEPQTKIVNAVNTRGAQPRWLKQARMEIDAETKVLRKLTVVRQVGRREAVTVSYTLASSEAQPDDRYELKGHLMKPYVIFSKSNQSQRRAEILAEYFGSAIARTLLTPLENAGEPSPSPSPAKNSDPTSPKTPNK